MKKKISLMVSVIMLLQILLPILTVIWENNFMIKSVATSNSLTQASKATEIFDPNGKDEEAEGYNPNKLHIGDFVNYDAGEWTADEISKIEVGKNGSLVSANNSKDLPKEGFQFGGFKEGDSRNGNATPYSDPSNSDYSDYKYVKDESGEAITGWRVFDVDNNGTITLISAGCPEDYYVPRSSTNDGYGGYISEYILSGNVNTSATSLNLESSYTKRDWSKYVNTSQHATSATVLTKTKLDEWYNKYMDTTNANTYNDSTFRTINGTRYDNLINNYSFYWLSAASSSSNVYFVGPNNPSVGGYNNYAFGVRPVVSLSSDVLLEKEGTKTLVDPYDGEKTHTYNVWNISEESVNNNTGDNNQNNNNNSGNNNTGDNSQNSNNSGNSNSGNSNSNNNSGNNGNNNKNNSNSNSNNTNNSSQSGNSTNSGSVTKTGANTEAEDKLPYTGSGVIGVSIVLLTIISGISYVAYKRYRNI